MEIINCEQIGNFIKYTCTISKSFIEYNIKSNIVMMNESYIDWDKLKLGVNLINYSLNDIIKNNINVTLFEYIVAKTEKEYLNMNNWKIMNDNNINGDINGDIKDDFIILQCPINNAVQNIIDGFSS